MPGQDTAFAVKKWQMYVGLAIGILTLGSMLGLKVITPAQTAVAASEHKLDAKILIVAKKHDQDIIAVIAQIKESEKNILDKTAENNREQIRLIVQALRSN